MMSKEISNTIPLGLEVNSLACSETIEDVHIPRAEEEHQIYIPHTKTSDSPCSAFSLLPDEILLVIFKMLPGQWKELLQLKTVCKHWNTLLQDTSLKYRKLSEDLYIMIKNEKKHYGLIKDYFGVGALREINPEMRAILVDWLVEVVEEFRLEGETLFLTIHYIDRYLSSLLETTTPITRGKLQLLGVTALLVASKYEEIYVPTIADIVYIADNTYKNEEVVMMEVNLLNALKFDISVCTTKRFVQYFLKTAETSTPAVPEKQRITLDHLANYIAELSLVDYRIASKRPSLVGASVVCLALHVLHLTWTYILESETQYSLDELNECVQDLWRILIDAPKSKLQAVYNKYGQSKFDSVSLTKVPMPFKMSDANINFIS